MNKKIWTVVLLGSFCVAGAVNAQVKPSDETSALVQGVTNALFDQLPKDDFETERAFMTSWFQAEMSPDEWATGRKKLVEFAGATPRFSPHRLTYYERDTLLAAVDFSGKANKENTYICGYVLWELPTPNEIGFFRLEQNVVDVATFQNMPKQEAAQLMTDWQCPPQLIEAVLEISASSE